MARLCHSRPGGASGQAEGDEQRCVLQRLHGVRRGRGQPHQLAGVQRARYAAGLHLQRALQALHGDGAGRAVLGQRVAFGQHDAHDLHAGGFEQGVRGGKKSCKERKFRRNNKLGKFI